MDPRKTRSSSLVPNDKIEHAILLIRGQKVLLDSDLAGLYGVETKALVRAVNRKSASLHGHSSIHCTRLNSNR